MIRFACPGCDAAFTVGDEKAGKTGKCPKCATQFVIPDAPAGQGGATGGDVFTPPPPVAPPPVVPPPPGPDDDVEIAPCPGCQKRLTVAPEDLGQSVECPFCQAVYVAERPGATPPRKRPGGVGDAPSGLNDRPRRDADERPSRRRREEPEAEEEEERPARRRRRDEDDEDERPSRRRAETDDDPERPSRRRRDEEDDAEEEDDRPRRKRRKRRRTLEPHRGGLILGLGIFGCACCGIVAIVTLVMAQSDLGKMSRGEMDDSGKGLTVTGMVFSIIGVVVMVGGIVANLAGVAGN